MCAHSRARIDSVFLNWFKIVLFLCYMPTFGLLLDTLAHAAATLMGFMIVFVVVFIGFAQAHAMVFGQALQNYRTLGVTCYTLLRSLLGDFDFEAMYEQDSFMGPFLFTMYITLAILVILNMIIAIIADAYVDSKEAMKKKEQVSLVRDIARLLLSKAEYIRRVPVVGSASERKLRRLSERYRDDDDGNPFGKPQSRSTIRNMIGRIRSVRLFTLKSQQNSRSANRDRNAVVCDGGECHDGKDDDETQQREAIERVERNSRAALTEGMVFPFPE